MSGQTNQSTTIENNNDNSDIQLSVEEQDENVCSTEENIWLEPELYDKTCSFDINDLLNSSAKLVDEVRRLMKILEKLKKENHKTIPDTYQLAFCPLPSKKNPSTKFYFRFRFYILQWSKMLESRGIDCKPLSTKYRERVEKEEHKDDRRGYDKYLSSVEDKDSDNVCQHWFPGKVGKFCKFKAYTDYVICETHSYVAAARPNKLPIITVCPKVHTTNTLWVQDEATWIAVLNILEKIKEDLSLNALPIRRIYINFGEWHSCVRKRLHPIDSAHAHINIVLTDEAINKCKNAPLPYYRLKDSTRQPPNYRLGDAVDWEEKISREEKISCEENISINTKEIIKETSTAGSSDIYWNVGFPHDPQVGQVNDMLRFSNTTGVSNNNDQPRYNNDSNNSGEESNASDKGGSDECENNESNYPDDESNASDNYESDEYDNIDPNDDKSCQSNDPKSGHNKYRQTYNKPNKIGEHRKISDD